jgi:hypothetical protein
MTKLPPRAQGGAEIIQEFMADLAAALPLLEFDLDQSAKYTAPGFTRARFVTSTNEHGGKEEVGGDSIELVPRSRLNLSTSPPPTSIAGVAGSLFQIASTRIRDTEGLLEEFAPRIPNETSTDVGLPKEKPKIAPLAERLKAKQSGASLGRSKRTVRVHFSPIINNWSSEI